MKIDLTYLCSVIGNLTGIPIRLYRKNQLIFSHSLVKLVKDPVNLYLDDLLSTHDNVRYFVTPIFNYYGIVKEKNCRIIIGPTRQLANNDQQLRELAFQCDVQTADIDDFLMAMKNIEPMPLDSLIQILFTLNHVLNGETRSLKDVRIFDSEPKNLEREREEIYIDKDRHLSLAEKSNNSFALEQGLMNIVRHGDSNALKEWIDSAPGAKSGIIAHEQLRQGKNTFIVSTTLACRNAIRGGMDVYEALSLSDAYIQKCELMTDGNQILNLQYQMIVDYTQRVERIRQGENPSKLTVEIRNYVLHHLSEPIKTKDLAKALYVSRSRLSTKFKEETGTTLSEFILKEKITEAKKLLRYSDKSITMISEYLGFSSQSHFNKVFKKNLGLSPKEYRQRKQ